MRPFLTDRQSGATAPPAPPTFTPDQQEALDLWPHYLNRTVGDVAPHLAALNKPDKPTARSILHQLVFADGYLIGKKRGRAIATAHLRSALEYLTHADEPGHDFALCEEYDCESRVAAYARRVLAKE